MSVSHYVIATIKPWNIRNFRKHFGGLAHFHLFETRESLTLEALDKINPRYIFFPHWSWMIPPEIWGKYECVVIHETDLPYGRGGSPIQNLIARGHTESKITALQVDAGLDTGAVYMKKDFALSGTAAEIFERVSDMVFSEVIPEIIKQEPQPVAQTGEVTVFKRRKPEDGNIALADTLGGAFDLIRMLDAAEYPKAFFETEHLRFEFSQAKFEGGKLSAQIDIHEKQ